MTASLSDQAWAEIREAVELTPDTEARAALSALLFEEYPAFPAYDREYWETMRSRSRRMLEHLGDFVGDHSALSTSFAHEQVEADIWHIAQLQRLSEAAYLAACAIRSAHQKRQNVKSAWFYSKLCSIWVDCFHGDLTVTMPPLGGPPTGPLIEFMLAAMRHLPRVKLPSPHTLHNAIERERLAREYTKQDGLQWLAKKAFKPPN